jgi:ribosome biogenesis GTPase
MLSHTFQYLGGLFPLFHQVGADLDRSSVGVVGFGGFRHGVGGIGLGNDVPAVPVAHVKVAIGADNGMVRSKVTRDSCPERIVGKALSRSLARQPPPSDLRGGLRIVEIQYHNDGALAIIHEVLPRKSYLRRKSAGSKADYQMIAVNIDSALIVQSCDFDFNLRRLERYLVMVNEGHIEPILLLTKSDLVSPEKLEQRISEVRQANIKCEILLLSNVTGFGVDDIPTLNVDLTSLPAFDRQ